MPPSHIGPPKYLVGLVHDGLCAIIHAKRITLINKDLCLVCKFCNNANAFDLNPNMP